MPPTTFRAQVSLPSVTNVPSDVITNTWHFRATPDAGSLDAYGVEICHELRDFYQSLDGVIFSSLAGTPATVKVYDLTDPEPRAVIHQETITITPAAGAQLPTEVAMCLSFQGAQIAGVHQNRRRGRLFLGPLTDTVFETVAGRKRFTTAAQLAVTGAAKGLLDNGAAALTPIHWCVYSPTTDVAGTLADASIQVTNGWVDNAPDTVRSRGTDATARAVFAAA
jgi:hypothetical protein